MADEVEQITATPKPAPKQAAKEKDPKKVAAGRKLAEYNKRAKEALAREMERAKPPDVKDDDSSEPGGWVDPGTVFHHRALTCRNRVDGGRNFLEVQRFKITQT